MSTNVRGNMKEPKQQIFNGERTHQREGMRADENENAVAL